LIYIIVPGYNEARNLPLLAKKTKAAMQALNRLYTLYVINDGSSDDTVSLCTKFAKEMPLRIISFPTNRGVDEAFRAGFREVLALVKEGDIIVTKEADNTSDTDILKHMVESVESGFDIVLASCFAKEGKVEGSSWDRHLLSFCANTLLKTFFPIKGVNTYSSFYRAYNAMTLRRAFNAYDGHMLQERGFVCMVEMVVKLARLGLRIGEVPMILRCDKREGISKMRRRKTILGYFKFIRKQMFRSRRKEAGIRKKFNALKALV
jgi:dolichol-phosphate mannosyltransferase